MTRIVTTKSICLAGLAAIALCVGAGTAAAHPGHGPLVGFAAGLAHPLTGLDHLLAMVAVGLWAGANDDRRIWLWPALFVGSMIAGAGLGLSGILAPSPEPLILASVLSLGLAVAFRLEAPQSMGGALIALFGLAHGYAHGIEMPNTASGLDFALGFVATTIILHSVGVGAAIGLRRLKLDAVMQFAGTGIAVAGLALILGT